MVKTFRSCLARACPSLSRPAILLLAAFLLAAAVPCYGLAGQATAPDTLFSVELTPGAVHTRYLLNGPNIMDVVAVDLDDPWLHFETARPHELTRTTELSRAADRPENRIIAAVNGDFFSFETHWPIANQLVRGEFVHGAPVRNRYHFAVDAEGRPFMDALSFRGSLTLSGKTVFPIKRINSSASDAGIVAYNRFYGEQTPRGGDLLEIVLTPRSPTSQHGSGVDLPMRITAIQESGGNSIPKDGYVIRIRDTEKASQIKSLTAIGDHVTFRAGFESGHLHLTDVMGGGVRILDDGQPYSGTNEARHPRTFVAMDRDTTTVFICTVDGRQLTSIGMSYREMADVLLQLGAWHAVNLDGGGSTTLVVRNEVANSPSDPGGERRVANALMLVSTAPGGDPERLEVQPESFTLYPHESQDLTIHAFDRFQNPVNVPGELKWEFDPVIGRLADGVFTPGTSDTSGTLTVRSGEISATTRARIHHYTSLSAEPESLKLAPGEETVITLTGRTADGVSRRIPVDRVRYRQPEDAVYLSHDGTVYATGRGEGELHLDIGSATASVPYNVSGDVVTRVIHDFSEGFDGWATPSQTHRSQILGVDPERSTLSRQSGRAVWSFVDDHDRDDDWDIRITRHLRQELGNLLYGSHVGVWVRADEEVVFRIVMRDGDGQLEAGPEVHLVPGQWQLVQTRLDDTRFEGYLNGDGRLTREGNQVNGFRITASGIGQGTTVTLEADRILASPFPIDESTRPE